MRALPLRSLKIAMTVAAAGTLVATALMSPVTQSQAYHHFADARGFGGIPNAWNVLSNLAYFGSGFFGVAVCLQRRPTGAIRAWIVFFAAIALVAPGSAVYHWTPEDSTLAWDRLPMAVSFMALLVAVVAESVWMSIERLLLPLCAAGAASVAYWHWVGDLRPYLWVQLFPLLVVILTLVGRPGAFDHRSHLPWALGCYAVAKLTEFGDTAVFNATGGTVGGHALKHLASAVGVLFVVRMLARRQGPDPQRAGGNQPGSNNDASEDYRGQAGATRHSRAPASVGP